MSNTTTYDGIGQRNFSALTNQRLAKLGFSIIGITSMPSFEGDVYLTDRAYTLKDAKVDGQFIRAFSEVKTLATTGQGAPDWDQQDDTDTKGQVQ